MTVTLPTALEPFVQRQLETGSFASAEEVVTAGLQLLLRQDEAWQTGAREKIDEGWNQAKAGELFTLEEARASLANVKTAWERNQKLK